MFNSEDNLFKVGEKLATTFAAFFVGNKKGYVGSLRELLRMKLLEKKKYPNRKTIMIDRVNQKQVSQPC